MDSDPSQKLLSTAEVAELTGYTVGYVSRLARTRRLPAERSEQGWFIRPEELESYLRDVEAQKLRLREALSAQREAEYRAHLPEPALERALRPLAPMLAGVATLTLVVFSAGALVVASSNQELAGVSAPQLAAAVSPDASFFDRLLHDFASVFGVHETTITILPFEAATTHSGTSLPGPELTLGGSAAVAPTHEAITNVIQGVTQSYLEGYVSSYVTKALAGITRDIGSTVLDGQYVHPSPTIGPLGSEQSNPNIILAAEASTTNGLTSTLTITAENGKIKFAPSLSGTFALAGGGTGTSTWYGGGIVFADGTKLTQASNAGSNSFYWDNVNSRLGIGTTTPAVALQVGGTGAIGIPYGTIAERPTGVTGLLRFNTETKQFEGYNGNLWAGLGGVIDVDQDTYILAESSPGANENTLFFNTAGTEKLRITPSGKVGIGTTSPGSTLSVQGDGYFSGSLSVGNNLTIQNGSISLGSATSTLTLSGFVGSSIIPAINKSYDLGSPSLFWRNGYLDSLTVNTLGAASTTISGTASNSFTINSDNATNDTEDANLIFFRGIVNPNAVLGWNSTLDRFEFNQPGLFWNQSSTTTIPSLIARGATSQTADIFQAQDSTGNVLTNITSAGFIGIGTTTPTSQIEIKSSTNDARITAGGASFYRSNGSLRFSGFGLGNINFGGTDDAFSTLTTGASISSRSQGNGSAVYSASPVSNLFFKTTGIGMATPVPRLWIDASGFVGIGDFNDGQDTTTGILPTNQLQIRLNAQSTAKTSDFSTLYVDNYATSTTNNIIKTGLRLSSTGSWTGTGASNIGLYVTSVTGGTNNYDAIFNGGGNVGVGTTSPWGLLSVNPNGISGPEFVIGSSSSTHLVVTNGGKVGLGTAAPAAQLTVNANATDPQSNAPGAQLMVSGNSSTGSAILIDGYASAPQIYFRRAQGSASAPSAVNFSGFNLANFLITDYTSAGSYSGNYTPWAVFSTQGWSGTGNGYNQIFSTTANGSTSGTERLRIEQNGNIGIASTTPWALLSVNPTNALNGAPEFAVGSSSATHLLVDGSGGVALGTTTAAGFKFYVSGGSPKLVLDDDGSGTAGPGIRFKDHSTNIGEVQYFITESRLRFFVGNTNAAAEKMTILSNGNVGIGTTTPWAQLSVVGGSTTAPVITARSPLNSGNGVNLLYLSAGNIDGVLTVNDQGNVIARGTLNVNSTGGNIGNTIIDSFSSAARLSMYDNAGVSKVTLNASGASYFTGGNLGLATTSPYATLSVHANNGSTNQTLFAIGSSTASATTTLFSVSNTGVAYHAGSVGIGVVSPAFPLDVAGPINTDKYSGFYQDAQLLAYASSTNGAIILGQQAGGQNATTSATVSGTIAIGYQALTANTAGLNNVAVGYQALSLNTTGSGNTALGFQTLQKNTGTSNTATGYTALALNTTGGSNTANGYQSLANNTNGNQNTAQGFQSLANNKTGSGNIGVGYAALFSSRTGSNNVALGALALQNNGSATSSVAVGYQAGNGASSYFNQGGTYLGYQSGFSAGNSSDFNTLVGYQAGFDITTGTNNLVLGTEQTTGTGITTGSNNILIGNGVSAGLSQVGSNQLNIGNLIFGTNIGTGATRATGNVGIGTSSPAYKLDVAGPINTDKYSGFYQDGLLLGYASSTNGATIFGLQAGGQRATTSASALGTTAFGYQTLNALSSGAENTAFGYQALMNNSTAPGNTALGYQALFKATTGQYNVGIGWDAVYNNQTTSNNIGIGNFALNNMNQGTGANIAIGVNALANGDKFSGVIGIGNTALNTLSNGTSTVAIGAGAADGNGIFYSAQGNVIIGSAAASRSSTGSDYSVVIGYQAGKNILASAGNIIIGANVDIPNASANNQLDIGNTLFGTGIYSSSGNSPVISGAPVTNATIGISSSTPYAQFAIQAVNGSTRTTLFAVGSSTSASATTTLFQLTNTGALTFGGYGAGTLQTDSSGNVTVSSDERLKDVQGGFTRGLADILKLNPILYHWNALSGLNQNDTNAGFSAQNVQSAIPEAVGQDKRGYLTLQDRPILAAAVNAIKDLAGQTTSLGAATTTLSTRVDGLQAQLTLRQALTATAISADSVAATGAVNAGSVLSGSVSSDTFLAPATQLAFVFGTTTVPAQLPSEVLTGDGQVNLYALASYALAHAHYLSLRVDALTLRVDDIDARLSALEAARLTLATSTPAVSDTATTTLADMFTGMGAAIENGLVRFQTLVARQFVASKDADGTSSAGEGAILAGKTDVIIANTLVHASSKIFITFTGPVDGWYVAEKKEGSFRVVLKSAAATDVTFDYFIVQTEVPTAAAVSTASPGGDTVAPVITLSGADPYYVPVGTTYTEPGVTAVDNVDGPVSYGLQVDGKSVDIHTVLDTSAPATYTLTYIAFDKVGNSSQKTRTVIVSVPGDTSGSSPSTAPDTTASTSTDTSSTPAPSQGTSDSPAPAAP